MPGSSRVVQERAAAEVARVYAEAEARLLALLARSAAAGMTGGYETWAAAKAREAAELARAAAALEEDLTATVTRLLQALVVSANVEAAGAPAVAGTPAAVQLLVQEAVEGVTASHTRLLRWVDDVFRQVQAEVAEAMATGTITLPQAVQVSLNRYAERGVKGFVDAAGRSWGLQEYAEMAIRTAVGRAHVSGTLDRYRGQGRQLVIVSDSPDECPWCRIWEGKVLGIDQAIVDGERYPTVADAISAGLLHPNCFPADVRVSGPRVNAADTRWYEGELVIIHTAGGDELPVTPNHPILTPEGWVAAGALNIGDQVVRHLRAEQMVLVGPDNQQVPSLIGNVPDTLRQSGPVLSMSVPSAPEQFHGDGVGGNVDVVLADSLLEGRCEAPGSHPYSKPPLISSGMGLAVFLRDRPGPELTVGDLRTTDREMGGGCQCLPFSIGHPPASPTGRFAAAYLDAKLGYPVADTRLGHLERAGDRRLGLTSQVPAFDLIDVDRPGFLAGSDSPSLAAGAHHPRLPQSDADPSGADTNGGRDLSRRLAGQITVDDVVQVDRRDFAGHVYNLQTDGGWYIANGIVVSNCTHSLGAYVPGLTRPMTGTENPEGYELRQEQRYRERQVRKWRRQQAVAITPEAEARAARYLAANRARYHEFIDRTGRIPQPWRTRVLRPSP